MNQYIYLFVWLAFMAMLSLFIPVKKWILVEGDWQLRWKLIWAVIAFFPIFRYVTTVTFSGDMQGYFTGYHRAPGTWGEIRSLIAHFKSGNGYYVFVNTVKMIFGDNLTAFRLTFAAVHSIPVVLIYRKYSSDYLLSLYLFVASGVPLAWMMNGMRQYMAVVLIFAATPWMIRKKYIPLVAVILLAATVHTSALIMLPVVFIVQGEAWNKRTVLWIALCVIATVLFSRNIELADRFLEGTEYEGTMAYYQARGDDGVNPFRVLVSAVPPMLALWGRRKVREEKDPFINICVNMSVIALGINLVAMVTSGIMVGRVPIYMSLYSLMLLPYLCKKLFKGQTQLLVTAAMIILYFLYFSLQYL